MCLLRRLALRRGVTYVFEPNGDTLRRTVERSFEAALDGLFQRGAFAGTRADAAYRVNVSDQINTAQRRDAGQFWIELQVAPALPMQFLTVRLARNGERVLSRETH
jgi:phage tail sheath protein FI